MRVKIVFFFGKISLLNLKTFFFHHPKRQMKATDKSACKKALRLFIFPSTFYEFYMSSLKWPETAPLNLRPKLKKYRNPFVPSIDQ